MREGMASSVLLLRGFFHLDDLDAVVVSAVLADAMRQHGGSAGGAGVRLDALVAQRKAAMTAAGLASLTLLNRHFLFSVSMM